MDDLQVRSHPARDLLQSADLFKTEKAVVWEYASNGLQYVDPGTRPEVHVRLDSKKHYIGVRDNGRGMLWTDLSNFFLMHGENLDRRQGRPGRGNFGTGKCAAFGIADRLRITTVRSGRRSCVELCRKNIEAMTSDSPIPVTPHEREVQTEEPNGTLVEIFDIHLRSLDQASVIRFIERHLVRWPRDVTVFVNNHQCEFTEPPVERELNFLPDEEAALALGSVKLTIKVAKAPLDDELRGVAIFSNGVWCETTLAGAEGRELSHHLFGEIDIPALDAYKGPIRPIDMSRSMKLNPNNPLVQQVYAFIGEKIETVRRELVKNDRERRATEELKRLQAEADIIADVLNEDFEELRARFRRVSARSTGGSDDVNRSGGTNIVELLTPGGETLGLDTTEVPDHPPPIGPRPPVDDPLPHDSIKPDEEVLAKDDSGAPLGSSTGRTQGRRQRQFGGFQVRFDNLGSEEHRAKYVDDERTIYINLDHPQLKAAKSVRDDQDIGFRRLAYEVAFAEYAVAVAILKAGRDEFIDLTDPIVEIRDALNRLAKKGARLYAVDAF